jgi:hypothetical protein
MGGGGGGWFGGGGKGVNKHHLITFYIIQIQSLSKDRLIKSQHCSNSFVGQETTLVNWPNWSNYESPHLTNQTKTLQIDQYIFISIGISRRQWTVHRSGQLTKSNFVVVLYGRRLSRSIDQVSSPLVDFLDILTSEVIFMEYSRIQGSKTKIFKN